MHIKPLQEPPTPLTSSAWDPFFEGFTITPTAIQREEIINLFIEHLSHMMYRHMQRMIDVYKKMRYGE